MASVAVIAVEYIASFLMCLYLIFFFKAPSVKLDTVVTVLFTWLCGLAGILLLPYDLSIAIVEERTSPVLEAMWEVVYWVTFLLAWVILPIQLEYHSSGHFTFSEKLRDSLQKNIVFFGSIGGLLVAIGLYVIVGKGMGLSDVTSLMMAIGNMYGILLLVVMMGAGVISLPRRLWQLSFPRAELTRLFYLASTVEAEFNDARYALEDFENDVADTMKDFQGSPTTLGASSSKAATSLDHVATLVDSFAFDRRSHASRRRGTHFRKADIPDPGTANAPDDYDPDVDFSERAVALHARCLMVHVRVRACERRWAAVLDKVHAIEESLGLSPEQGGVALGGVRAGRSSSWGEMPTESGMDAHPALSRVREAVVAAGRALGVAAGCLTGGPMSTPYTQTSQYMLRMLAVGCAFLSLVVLWSQLVAALSMQSLIAVLLDECRESSLSVQIASFIVLAYMGLCTYYSLFTLKIGWHFSLAGPHQSPPSSLIFNAEYFSRLQFSLGFNFLLSVQSGDASRAAFQSVVRRMTVLPTFDSYLPLIMVTVAAAVFFHAWGRLLNMLRMCGIDMAAESEELGTSPMGMALAWGQVPDESAAAANGSYSNSRSNGSGEDARDDGDADDADEEFLRRLRAGRRV